MDKCPNCGEQVTGTPKFCRQCGHSLLAADEEAATWRLAPGTRPNTEPPAAPTTPVRPASTGEPVQPTGPAYIPPAEYYTPTHPAPVYQPEIEKRVNVSVGDWLTQGWRVYKENWFLMSIAALIGAGLSTITISILAGPLLMGMFIMAFKTLRGERPTLNDLFDWKGRFFQAVLVTVIFIAAQSGLSTGSKNHTDLSLIFILLYFVLGPFLVLTISLSIPLILERKMDVATAVNEVGKLIFSRDALMWWIVGLVMATLGGLGMLGCGVGVFITFPWMVCSAAVMYRDIFGLFDPNRTLH